MQYLVYYDTPANAAENRNYAPAAADKINYICSVLTRIGESVELISASMSHNKCGGKGKVVQIADQTTLQLFPCLGTGKLPKRILRRLLFNGRLFLHLLFHIKKGEDLLVYHSLGYANMVRLLRKLKKFRLILEVEEIYADVNGRKCDRKKEFRLFSEADAFLFPTGLLNEKINIRQKPYTLIHGTYQVEPDRNIRYFDDGKIHCVYAGTFDPRKGGAMAAADAARFLPEQYHVHILGFGGKEQVQNMKEHIDTLAKTCRCGITYEGLLQGEEYITFLQSCDIGLSTQNPDAAFNATSFPSKILSYMANGLRVVSIRIPAVEGSAVGKWLYYYEEQTSESIAEAVRKVSCKDAYKPSDSIGQLDTAVKRELRKLLNYEDTKS